MLQPLILYAALVLMVLATSGRAHGQTAPVANAPRPPAVETLCPTGTEKDFVARGRGAPGLQIHALGSRFSEAWENKLLVSKPAGSPAIEELRFVGLLVTREAPAQRIELRTRRARSPERSILEQAGLTDPTTRVELRVATDPTSRLLPLKPLHDAATISLFACGPGNRVIGFGETDVRLVYFRQAQAIGVAAGLALYILAAIAVWSTRRRIAEASKSLPTTTSTTPLRWYVVRPPRWWEALNPVVITADSTGKGSLSNLQVLVFSMVVIGGLAMIVLLKGLLSELSESVVWLLGLPAAGSIGSQVASNSRDRLSTANWAWLVSRSVLPVNDPNREKPSWRDILASNQELDLYKLQAAGFSVLVIVAMLVSMSRLDTFSVPQSMLYILGLSQVVFVGGRFTKPATLADLDALITELKQREHSLRIAAATGIDVGADGQPLPGAVPNTAAPFKTIAEAQDAKAVPVAANRYRETAAEVEVLLKGLTHRDVDGDQLKHPSLA